ncbi:MAG TPA: hypothetical protein VHH88_00740 [Verrucomicrobiae bacterium]|nr:hypothetical protein [Verrucomicrobiae bacterium]
MLLLLLGLALGLGSAMVVLVAKRPRHSSLSVLHRRRGGARPAAPIRSSPIFSRPFCWLSIRSRNLQAVQAAFGLHNPKPCSWLNGLAGEEKLFIAPPVKGWIIVVGSGLPDPTDDVDAAFRFIMALSRKFGEVQCFSANRVLQHHAWVKAESGRVVRAYAWAGRTLWKQGRRTPAERELDVVCFDYAQAECQPLLGGFDVPAANVEKVPLLAARWSLDPAAIDEHFLVEGRGVAGEPSRHY